MVYQFSCLVRDEEVFSYNRILSEPLMHDILRLFVVFSEREERGGGEEKEREREEEEKKEELFKIPRFHSIRKRIHERLCLGVWYSLIRENIREDWLV